MLLLQVGGVWCRGESGQCVVAGVNAVQGRSRGGNQAEVSQVRLQDHRVPNAAVLRPTGGAGVVAGGGGELVGFCSGEEEGGVKPR